MFRLRKAKIHTLISQTTRFVRLKGVNGNFISSWQKKTRQRQKNCGFLIGIGCSVATIASFSFAFGEKGNQDETDCSDGNIVEVASQGCESESRDVREQQIKEAIRKSRLKLEQVKEETGSPGLVCAVSIDGKVEWSVGLGFANVENGLRCHDGTLMRIASISKALTSIALGKLIQEMKLDIDAPVQEYVSYFPEKEYKGEKVTITTRQLMSHTSGLRHYQKELSENEAGKADAKSEEKGKDEQCEKRPLKDGGTGKHGKEAREQHGKENEAKKVKVHDDETKSDSEKQELEKSNRKEKTDNGEFKMEEYYIKDHYKTVKDAINIFKDDPLLKEPGTDYLYTTHGWTLLSACIEGASGKDYVTYMKEMCYDLGLDNTIIELNDPIIYNRSNYYIRDSKGKLQNTPYVDNSYKWAGGGFLSTVGDLVKIGNIMLYSSQCEKPLQHLKGFLNRETIDLFWTPEPVTIGKVSKKRKKMSFGLGWQIQPKTSSYGCCRETKFAALHSGAAIGASSILLIVPSSAQDKDHQRSKVTCVEEMLDNKKSNENNSQNVENRLQRDSGIEFKDTGDSMAFRRPQGIVVAIMVNMQEVGLTQTAFEIAENFTFEI